MFYKLETIFYRKEKGINANLLLEEITSFIKIIPDWIDKPSRWLIAHPKKELIAIENSTFTEKARAYINEISNEKPSLNITLADEKKDASILTISLMNTPAISPLRFYLSLTIKKLDSMNNKDVFIEYISKIIKMEAWEFKYIMLDTEQYGMRQQAVFEDRIPVGWILFLPMKIASDDIPSAQKVMTTLDKSGTIVLTKDNFNGKKPGDILAANNIEIELAAHGYLPKWTEL